MSSPWYILVFIVLFLIVLYLVTEGVQYLYEQIIEQFAILNSELKLNLVVPPRKWLSFQSRYPSISGKFLDRHLSIVTTDIVIGGVTFPNTKITLDAMHYGKTMSISSETIYTMLKKLWGKNDISLKDPEFDRMFYITANDPKFVQRLLDRDIRDVMKESAFLQSGKFTLEQAQLKYEEQVSVFTVNRRRRIEKVILVMYMMTKRMEQLRDNPILR